MTLAATPVVKHLADLVPYEVRRDWSNTGLYRDRDLYSLFREHVLAGPRRTAIVDADGEISYAELDLMARSLAVGLAGIGVEQGDVVGIQLPNGRLACAFDLAIAALGAISLPYPVGRGDREAASLLSRSGAVAVVTTNFYSDYPCAQRTRALAGELPELRTVIAAGRRCGARGLRAGGGVAGQQTPPVRTGLSRPRRPRADPGHLRVRGGAEDGAVLPQRTRRRPRPVHRRADRRHPGAAELRHGAARLVLRQQRHLGHTRGARRHARAAAEVRRRQRHWR